jgi:hypothetical protein
MTSALSARFSRLRMLWMALPLCIVAAGCGNSISPSGGSGPQTATTTTITASVTTLSTSQTTTLTATVTNASGAAFVPPAGTLEFLANGNFLVDGQLQSNTVSGSYTSTYTATLQGSQFPTSTDTITAVYQGDSLHTTSTSTNNIVITITGSTTGIATTTTLAQTAGAQSVLLTATVTPATGSVLPSGEVAFVDVTNASVPVTIAQAPLSTGSSTATASINLTSSNLSAGAHQIQAEYLGGTTNGTTFAASNSQPQSVTLGSSTGSTPSTTALVAMPTSITSGQTTTLTATITGNGTVTPTGTINFYDQTNNKSFGTVTVVAGVTAGTATATISPSGSAMATGNNTIIAEYSGDSTYVASTSSSATVAVTGSTGGGGQNATTTVVTASPTSIAPGGCINITAAVSGPVLTAGVAPTGTVTLTVNGLTLGTVGVSYMADGTSDGYTGICSNPGTVLGGSGTYQIVASYSGDSNYSASNNGTGTQVTVTGTQKANTNLAVGVPEGVSSTISLGSCGEVQGTVTPVAEPNGTAPTGSVIFQLNYTTQIGDPVTLGSGGVATLTICTGSGTSITSKGSYTINATYGGDNTFNASTSYPNATIVVD